MKRIFVCLILVLGVSPSPSFGADDAPSGLAQLQFRYEIELEKLRAKYLKSLEKLIVKQTKAGNLAAAVEARKVLEEVREELGHAASEIPKDDAGLTKFLTDSKWHAGKLITGKDGATSLSHILTFRADGKVHKSWGKLRPTWKVKGMKLYYEKKVFGFDDGFTQMTRLSGDPADPKVWKLGK